MFTEETKYSWRKILTGLAALMFLFDGVMNWIKIGELPSLHLTIISGVFAFYFSKELINKLGNNK